ASSVLKDYCYMAFIEVRGSKTLEYAKHRFVRHRVHPGIYDETPPIPNGPWDLIIAMDVLEHIAKPEPIIEMFASMGKYLICNCDHLPTGVFFQQHIPQPDVKPYFRNLGGDLYKTK